MCRIARTDRDNADNDLSIYLLYQNIYIFMATTIAISVFLEVIHFQIKKKNITSRGPETLPMGGATSKAATDVVCSLWLA